MATVAVVGTPTWNTTAGDKTVVATPAANDLIIVVAGTSGLAGGTTAVSDTQGDGGTYTQVDTDRTGFSTTGVLTVWVRSKPIVAAASTTWTASQAGSTGGGLAVLAIRGAAKYGTNAVRSTGGQSTVASGTPAPVLSLTPKNMNPIITAVMSGTNGGGTTARSSPAYTDVAIAGYTSPATGFDLCYIETGETSATITWGGAAPSQFASVAIEIDADTPTFFASQRRFQPHVLERRRSPHAQALTDAVLEAGDTYTKQGAGVSEYIGSGADAVTFAETGTGIATFVGSGGDATTFAETGTGIITAIGSGASEFAKTYTKTGTAVAGYVGSGSDAFTTQETGTGIASFIGAGGDATTFVEAGTGVINAFVGSGADATTYGEAGTGIANFIGTGGDAVIFAETGTGIINAVGSGTAVVGGGVEYTKAGTGFASFIGAGGDATTFVEAGTGIITGVGSGAKVREHKEKAGSGIAAYIGSGARARELLRTGSGIAAYIGVGSNAIVWQEAGTGIANLIGSGSRASVYGESGTGIISFVGLGASQYITAVAVVDFFDPPSPTGNLDSGSPDSDRYDLPTPTGNIDDGSPVSDIYDSPNPSYA